MANQYTTGLATKIPPIERFWRKVRVQPNGCWLWIGCINNKGSKCTCRCGGTFHGQAGATRRAAIKEIANQNAEVAAFLEERGYKGYGPQKEMEIQP